MASPAATPDPRDPHATPRSALPIFLTCWLALLADGYDLYVYGATLPGFIGPQNWGVTREQAVLPPVRLVRASRDPVLDAGPRRAPDP